MYLNVHKETYVHKETSKIMRKGGGTVVTGGGGGAVSKWTEGISQNKAI